MVHTVRLVGLWGPPTGLAFAVAGWGLWLGLAPQTARDRLVLLSLCTGGGLLLVTLSPLISLLVCALTIRIGLARAPSLVELEEGEVIEAICPICQEEPLELTWLALLVVTDRRLLRARWHAKAGRSGCVPLGRRADLERIESTGAAYPDHGPVVELLSRLLQSSCRTQRLVLHFRERRESHAVVVECLFAARLLAWLERAGLPLADELRAPAA